MEVNAAKSAGRKTVPSIAWALTTIFLGAASAQAAPPETPLPAQSCTFKLTAPFVVKVSGTDMVAATISPGACTEGIQPNSFTVCVEMSGNSRPQCNFRPVYDPVTVYFAPYRSGTTYRSTGRGCGNVFPMADESCFSVGPYSATL